MNLWEALTGREAGRATLHAWNGERFEHATWSEVVSDAERMAAGLRARGVQPGTIVGSVLTNSPLAVRGILAVWLAGGTLASLPVPARGMTLEEYASQLRLLVERAGIELFVADDGLLGALPDPSPADHVASWASLPVDQSIDFRPPGDDEIAFIQYSSGSTSLPKGCMLTARAIAEQLAILREMADAEPGAETVASWLPLSHDMGAFGCLLFAWAHGFDLVLSSPERFMQAPRTWFGDCADYGATLSAGPTSALHFAARSMRTSRLSNPLKLKVCVVGAERVDWETIQRVTEVLGPYGFEDRVLMPAYGLAEATLVVSAVGARERPSYVSVDGAALADGEILRTDESAAASTKLVSVGRPCRGVEVVLDRPGRLSEISVRSPSLALGYHNDPERTAGRFRDGAVRTGDLGFEHAGEVYIVGRDDDVLSIGGRQVYAGEIEAAVSSFEGFRAGCCTLIDIQDNGARKLVMLAEVRDGHQADLERLAALAARTATSKAGVNLDECLFLPKGSLPKTPSGKVQRFRCRQLLLAGELEPEERVCT